MAISKETADKLLSQAYEQYYDVVLAVCRQQLRECKDYAEDCVQKTFIFYYNKLLEGEEVEYPKTYLYSIARMTCKKEYLYFKRRQAKTTDIDDAAELVDPVQDFDLINAADLDYDEIAKVLLSKLTDDERTLFTLKYIEKKSLKEIGELLDLKPNTVAKRLSRTGEKIKQLVTPVLENYRKGG